MSGVNDLDPRWEWIELRLFGEPGPLWVRGACRHTELADIETVDGELAAQLCLTCDTVFYLI